LTSSSTGTDYSWQLSADQTNLYKSNGLSATTANYNSGANPASGFGINVGHVNSEFSTWQVADLMVFNRTLSLSEISQVENYMSLIYGLTSPPSPIISPPNANESGLVARFDATNQSSYSETSTAWNDISGNGRNAALTTAPCSTPRHSSFNGGALSFDGSTNCALVGASNFPSLETFTVEMWVNPRRGVTQTSGSALISTPHSPGQNVNFSLHLDGGNVFGGSFNRATGDWKTTAGAALPAGDDRGAGGDDPRRNGGDRGSPAAPESAGGPGHHGG
jgi:hypothetical protein